MWRLLHGEERLDLRERLSSKSVLLMRNVESELESTDRKNATRGEKRTHGVHLARDVEDVGQQERHESRLARLLEKRRQDLPTIHLVTESGQDAYEALEDARLRLRGLRRERVAFEEAEGRDEEGGEV